LNTSEHELRERVCGILQSGDLALYQMKRQWFKSKADEIAIQSLEDHLALVRAYLKKRDAELKGG